MVAGYEWRKSAISVENITIYSCVKGESGGTGGPIDIVH
jgi:hypothetical protein